jgi:hypothetical protein
MQLHIKSPEVGYVLKDKNPEIGKILLYEKS